MRLANLSQSRCPVLVKNTVQRKTDVTRAETTEILLGSISNRWPAQYYHSCRSCNKMGPGCRGLPADNRVPEGGLADGGRGAFLSRSRRQEAQAGELVSQSHPEHTAKHTDTLTLPGCAAAVEREKCDRADFHLYLLCMMA